MYCKQVEKSNFNFSNHGLSCSLLTKSGIFSTALESVFVIYFISTQIAKV